MKSYVDATIGIIKRILLGAFACFYMSLSLHIYNNKEDFILGDYVIILIVAFILFIFYCVGEIMLSVQDVKYK